MPTFYCPVCNHKSLTEKEEREHAKTHKSPAEPGVMKPREQKNEVKIPDFIRRFLHKTVSILLINGSTISGKLTGFNNYDIMLDNKTLIPKHSILTMQEVETKP